VAARFNAGRDNSDSVRDAAARGLITAKRSLAASPLATAKPPIEQAQSCPWPAVGNLVDPETSAAAMKRRFAEMEAKT
jgi:hypothetical protein